MCTSCTILTKIATFAPSLLHIRARALPIPRPAPVTTTRWPAKRAEDIIMEVDVMCSVMISRIDSNFDVMEECSWIFEEGILQQQWATARRARATGRVVACACCLYIAQGFCVLRLFVWLKSEKCQCQSLSLSSERENAVPCDRNSNKMAGPKDAKTHHTKQHRELPHHQSQHHGKRRE